MSEQSVTFPLELGGDGNTYTGDSNPTTGMGDGGHRERFVPALHNTVAMAESAKDSAVAANSSMVAAAGSATSANSSKDAAALSASAALTSRNEAATFATNAAASANSVGELVTEAQLEQKTNDNSYRWSPKRIYALVNNWWGTLRNNDVNGLLVPLDVAESTHIKPTEGFVWSVARLTAWLNKRIGTSAGQVMPVGAFGLQSIPPLATNHINSGLSVWRDSGAGGVANRPPGYDYGSGISIPYGVEYNTSLSFSFSGSIFYSTNVVGVVTSRELLHTGNILQTQGTSTDFPMSQKAVTDALGQPSFTGSLSANGTTNVITFGGVVSTLSLEVGDVIQISGSPGGLNDKLFTVESIVDNDVIKVNYEHAGNRSDGSLRLVDQTATATITRIAKWYNAPTGLGQAWVNVTGSRSVGTTYTNTTGRPIQLNFNWEYLHTSPHGIVVSIDDVIVTPNALSGLSTIIPSGSAYRVTLTGTGQITDWLELR